MQEPIYDFFFQQGILGVLVILGTIVIGILWRKYENLRDEIQTQLINQAQQMQTLQEEKLEMQREHLDTLLQVKDEVTEVTNRITNTMEALVSALTGRVDEQ
jgi:flagellar biosynthesis/type III secretory pathway M-ring protein FliF/YscJ